MKLLNICVFFLIFGVKCTKLPENCKAGEYYETGTLSCISCPVNSSMVTSNDGLSCACDEHSYPLSPTSCRTCSATELLSSDGGSCVPRKCQSAGGRLACRKCPAGYISVTQNLDGSNMKEVQCIKCASGYKPHGNTCIRCESCSCTKQQMVVRGICIPKKFVNSRPKYEEGKLHQDAVHEVLKYEYLCTQNDILACRSLADACVKSFYSSDLGSPCRLWILSKAGTYKYLPPLNIETTVNDKSDYVITLPKGKSALELNLAVHAASGGFAMVRERAGPALECVLPLQITVGRDVTYDCILNVSKLPAEATSTLSPYLIADGDLKLLPLSIKKPSGSYIQKGSWPNTKFRRYFLVHKYLSTLTNTTTMVYLRTLSVLLRLERSPTKSGSISIHLTIEAQYATQSSLSQTVTTTLKVQNVMPSAGVLKGLEVWCSVLGSCLCAHALVVWRGTVRRGGPLASVAPMLAGAVADALYFGAWFATLHAVAAEAGTLGITLPMSTLEENMLNAFIYSAVSLKAAKVLWINWKQCRCDIFFLDWSEYNPPYKDGALEKDSAWRALSLAREWSHVQTKRRASPWYTITLALCICALLAPWQSHLPHHKSYVWSIGMLAWWAAYLIVLTIRWILDKVFYPFTENLPKICNILGLSLIVFQEEYYAHYVHGRNDEFLDTRIMSGSLKTCRVVCAPQLRTIYKQLLTPVPGMIGETESRHALLSKFLAAFFEKALDGLSWVCSERTVVERLLDVELTPRESANTSVLLYDPEQVAPSCFNVTWWGEEWNLATLDAMMFGTTLIIRGDSYLAALITLVTWQSMKIVRSTFGDKNQMEKTRVNKNLHR